MLFPTKTGLKHSWLNSGVCLIFWNHQQWKYQESWQNRLTYLLYLYISAIKRSSKRNKDFTPVFLAEVDCQARLFWYQLGSVRVFLFVCLKMVKRDFRIWNTTNTVLGPFHPQSQICKTFICITIRSISVTTNRPNWNGIFYAKKNWT